MPSAIVKGDEKDIELLCEIASFGRTVAKYIVLLRDEKKDLKGTGYIVTANTLITPSEVFQNYEKFLKFNVRTKLGHGGRTIFDNTTYCEFLSVARVSSSKPIHLLS